MTLFALGFVFGAWLLQQQSNLPALQTLWILAPSLIIFIKFQHQLLKRISLFISAVLFGFFWAAIFATFRLSHELPQDWQQKNIEIIGVVASLPEVTERRERFRFDVERVLTQGVTVPQHISLNFYREIESPKPENAPALTNHFHAGERWQFTVRLKRPHSTYNPHGFDFEAWALAENIRATGAVRNKSGYNKLENFVWKPRYLIENAREKIGIKISQTLTNKLYAGVIRALVVGDDSQISQAQWDVFFKTGVGHLVSISGLHITMLSGLAFAVAAFIWRRCPSLVMRLPTRKAATIAGVLIALLYAALAGWSVPTQRTILMLVTFAVALLLARRVAILRVLAIALIVVVLCDPWAVNAPGFWLSFGAIALIAYVTVARLKPAHWLKTAIHTQWAITLGLLPLLIVMFGQASIVSPLANAFAIPIISLLVVPLAIFGSLLQLDFILQIAHFILEVCMHGLDYLANLPTWQQATPPMWTLLVAMFGVLWLLLPRGFPQRWLGLILLMSLFFVETPKPESGEMRVAVLDVGQGLAVVIQTANRTLLYDAGSRYSAQSDAGSNIIVPYLRGEGIVKLDGFIVSHNDIDHSGGAASILKQVRVGWLASSFDFTVITPQQKSIKCFAGQHWVWDKVRFEVLHPSLESYENGSLKDNNRSCVIKVTSQFGSILLTGDIEKEAEKVLLEDALQANIHETSGDVVLNSKLKSDVIIVPHHGSKTSSTVNFVQAVGAKHSIFTVGYLNRFKHPKPMIEKRFEESGAHIYRSDNQGAILLDFTRNAPLKIDAWRQLRPKYWHGRY
jgi:competence protein ComEC